MIKKCKFCNGKLKLLEKEYVIRTRNQQRPEMIFENLKVLQCTVCEHKELTEDSEEFVKLFRNKIRNEVKKPEKTEQTNPVLEAKKMEKNHFSFVKDAIRKWIG